MIERPRVLGCQVDILEPDSLLATLQSWAASDSLIDIVTLNPEQIMAARRSPEVAELLKHADVCSVDGVGLQIALRLRGLPNVARVTGVDLLTKIAKAQIPLFLLGGAAGSAEIAAERLEQSVATATIAGAWSGGTPRPEDDPQSIARISATGARAVAVAYGAPAQTEWIERNRDRLEASGVRIAVGVGGALDYHAGVVRRAPGIVQRAGLEWLYRLIREPWRLQRQRVLPIFAVLAFSESLLVRFRRS